MTTTAPHAPPAPPARKFSATTVTTAADRSAGKNIITGASGKGKTYFVSTIVAEDGRPVFIVPVEEGLKGASPNHAPAKFGDAAGNPVLPANFAELMTALVVFRDELNVMRPPVAWLDGLGYPAGDPALDVLRELVDVFPAALPPTVISTRAGVASSIVDGVLEALVKVERARRDPSGSFAARPDKTWRRPHLHLGLDSLSGVETLIHREVTKRNDVSSMADKEFNVLFTKCLPLWQEFRDLLDSIRRTGVHVWLVAHSDEGMDAAEKDGALYRTLDLMFRGSGKALIEIRQFWRQWADSIFYVVTEVAVKEATKGKRAVASIRGRRLITQETAQCRAKSRYALPPALPASWPELVAAMKAGITATPEKLRARVLALVPRLDADTQAPMLAELEASAMNAGRLAALLSRMEGLVLCAEEARAEAAQGAAAPDDEPPAQGAGETPPAAGDASGSAPTAGAASPPASAEPPAEAAAEMPPGL